MALGLSSASGAAVQQPETHFGETASRGAAACLSEGRAPPALPSKLPGFLRSGGGSGGTGYLAPKWLPACVVQPPCPQAPPSSVYLHDLISHYQLEVMCRGGNLKWVHAACQAQVCPLASCMHAGPCSAAHVLHHHPCLRSIIHSAPQPSCPCLAFSQCHPACWLPHRFPIHRCICGSSSPSEEGGTQCNTVAHYT